MRPLSARIEGITPSGSREIVDVDWDEVLYLSSGTIDFEILKHVHEAGVEAIREDFTAYTNNQGYVPLREAITEKLARDNNVEYDVDEVLVTSGSSEALGAIAQAVLDPGDEAIIFDPHYVGGFGAVVQLASGVKRIIPTKSEDNWNPDPQAVRDAITPRTKLLFLVSPNNPTGSALTEETVRSLAEIARRHDLYVVSDELYERIMFDGKRVFSPASLPEMWERTFTVNGFSKGFGMTGWRVGYVAAPKPLLDAVRAAQNYVGICAPSISQRAALAALTGPQEPVHRMVEDLQRRRDFVVQALNEVEGLAVKPQDGTFYTFVDAREFMREKGQEVQEALNQHTDYQATGTPSKQLSDFLVIQGQVYVSSGGTLGAASDGWFRISEADRMTKLEEGVDRIKNAIESI